MDPDVTAAVKPWSTPTAVIMEPKTGNKSAGNPGFRRADAITEKKGDLRIPAGNRQQSPFGQNPVDEGGGELPAGAAGDHPGSGANRVAGALNSLPQSLRIDPHAGTGGRTAAGSDDQEQDQQAQQHRNLHGHFPPSGSLGKHRGLDRGPRGASHLLSGNEDLEDPMGCLLLVATIALCAPLITDDRLAPEVQKKIDGVFSRWDGTDRPGCSVGIIRDGKLVLARGYGMANLDHAIANGPDSVFRIGSTSKQFTAACMMLLEEQGFLSLDDDIRKFLPEMQEHTEAVTIRHLLHHTSGIRDYITLDRLQGHGDEYPMSVPETLAALARQKGLNFPPGSAHLYSNSGYFLLSVICQRASGVSLREYADKNIFGPLGMTSSHYHDDHNEVVHHRAAGYSPDYDGGYRINQTVLDHVGDGGVFTTVEDLARWDRSFYDGGVGNADLWKKMVVPGVLDDGKVLGYAAGLGIGKHRGAPMILHGGAWVGYRAEMVRFPEHKLTIICLANCSAVRPTPLCLAVADILLADELEPAEEEEEDTRSPRRRRNRPQESAEDVEVTAEDFVGRYHSEELQVSYLISRAGSQLHVEIASGEVVPLRVVAIDRFRASGNLRLDFIRDEGGEVIAFTLDAGRVRDLRFAREGNSG
ncbi:MAG TPA: class A beta-lactamase-related serine hydrolase [Planctomycetes bacterium]|nr:class A beta-lactamase-related serine hydrolase [Planctomycetota bacterium]